MSVDRNAELRANFNHFFAHQPDPYGSSVPVFKFESDYDGRVRLPEGNTLVDEVELLRKRIIHPFRIRGTSADFMEQARQGKLFSAKKVDAWYENDVGSIATYRVPTADHSLASAEFLYLLQFTTIAAFDYARNHAEWGLLDRHDLSFDDCLESTRRFFTFKHPNPKFRASDAAEIAACYEELVGPRHHLVERYMKPDLNQRGFTSFGYGGAHFDPYGYERIKLWDKSLAPFRESRFNPTESVENYSPFYIRVEKQEVLDLLDKLGNLNSDERMFAEQMAAQAWMPQPLVRDSVLHLIGEQITLELIRKLHSWEHDNEPLLQFKKYPIVD